MGIADIREKLHGYIDRADDRLLNLIYAMMQADLNELGLNEEQKHTLDKRIASHQENPLAGSNWKDVKARIKKQL
jgi:putative addiction module component (TIGR02574 family)